tara:strand:+ start:1112 stop:1627 length:516 start_codon:yes stop_codon:yes gene_type:complete
MDDNKICPICYNKIDYIISCNNCSNNIDDPKDICHNCIIKLKIEDNFLMDKNIIEDDKVDNKTNYEDILVIYTCPYCKENNDYKITEIKNNNNLIKLFIILFRDRLYQSYKNDEFLNKVLAENIIIKKQLKTYENKYKIIDLFNQKYYSIIIVILLNFCFLLGFTIIINIK